MVSRSLKVSSMAPFFRDPPSSTKENSVSSDASVNSQRQTKSLKQVLSKRRSIGAANLTKAMKEAHDGLHASKKLEPISEEDAVIGSKEINNDIRKKKDKTRRESRRKVRESKSMSTSSDSPPHSSDESVQTKSRKDPKEKLRRSQSLQSSTLNPKDSTQNFQRRSSLQEEHINRARSVDADSQCRKSPPDMSARRTDGQKTNASPPRVSSSRSKSPPQSETDCQSAAPKKNSPKISEPLNQPQRNDDQTHHHASNNDKLSPGIVRPEFNLDLLSSKSSTAARAKAAAASAAASVASASVGTMNSSARNAQELSVLIDAMQKEFYRIMSAKFAAEAKAEKLQTDLSIVQQEMETEYLKLSNENERLKLDSEKYRIRMEQALEKADAHEKENVILKKQLMALVRSDEKSPSRRKSGEASPRSVAIDAELLHSPWRLAN